jgi:hypothetical protein
MLAAIQSQSEFYREFIMARRSFKPQDFGVDIARKDFDDTCIEDFNEAYRSWTIDELLLHPAEAQRFCSDVRRKHAWYDVPDDIILRVILTDRKNPD